MMSATVFILFITIYTHPTTSKSVRLFYSPPRKLASGRSQCGKDVNGEATGEEFGMSAPQSDDGRVLADRVWLNMMSRRVS